MFKSDINFKVKTFIKVPEGIKDHKKQTKLKQKMKKRQHVNSIVHRSVSLEGTRKNRSNGKKWHENTTNTVYRSGRYSNINKNMGQK